MNTLNNITIESDGDDLLPPVKNNVFQRRSTTIVVESNIDGATLMVGYTGKAGFVELGPLVQGAVFNHGVGANLIVRSSGIGANPVVIGYEP